MAFTTQGLTDSGRARNENMGRPKRHTCFFPGGYCPLVATSPCSLASLTAQQNIVAMFYG